MRPLLEDVVLLVLYLGGFLMKQNFQKILPSTKPL